MSSAEARRMIMRGLRNGAGYQQIDFQISGFQVTAAGLGEVHDAVAQQRIGVLHDPTMRGAMMYQPDRDRFITPTDHTGGDPLVRALIVHEGVHAFCDLRNAHWMEVQTSEAAAHIAQSLCYLLITGGNSGRITHQDSHYDTLFERSWEVARKLHRAETPSWGDYEAVRGAVAQVPTYAAKIGRPVG